MYIYIYIHIYKLYICNYIYLYVNYITGNIKIICSFPTTLVKFSNFWLLFNIQFSMVSVKWDFLIETSLGIGSICEKVAADTTLVGLVGRGISDPVLTPEMLSDRSSSDLILQQYNHPTNRTVRCPMRNHVPRKTSQLPSVVNGPRRTLTPKSFIYSARGFGFIACLRGRGPFVTQRISIR